VQPGTWFVCLYALLVLSVHAGASDGPLVLAVWPDKTVGDTPIGAYGPIGPEKVRDPSDSPTKDAKWITNVTRPTLSVFRPDDKRNTRTAVIICPGGGYWNLAWDLEGEEVAAWLNSIGVTGVVLKYRVPRRAGVPEPQPAPGPLLDAQRAVSLVRSKAKEWKIDPDKIGIVGFSAGGHLALSTAMSFEKRAYDPVDDADKASCRPDFAIAVYPGYLVEKESTQLAPYIHIPSGMPPIFLAHATDDTVASSNHSVVMYLALKQAGIPVELHVYAAGGHGFGVRKKNLPCSKWTEQCAQWLVNLGKLKPR
jgi:Esterase/lipase